MEVLSVEYQFYEQNNKNQPSRADKRSSTMETASVILGTFSLFCCFCLCSFTSFMFLSLICSSLAIILALLSRGGEAALGARAKVGLGLGIGALTLMLLLILLCILSFLILLNVYGSVDGIIRALQEMSEMNYNDYYNSLYNDIYNSLYH